MKKFLIIASLCVVLGGATALTGCAMMDFNLKSLDKNKGQTKTYTVDETFDKIDVNVDTADVTFALSDDGTCKVVCVERKKMPYSVSVENQTLSVSMSDQRKWYDHIGFSFTDIKVQIQLPLTAYTSLALESDTGDIYMPSGFTFTNASLETDTGDIEWSANVTQALILSTDTGDVSVKNCTLGSANLETDTGDIDAENLNVSGALQMTRTTGDAELENVKCTELSLRSDTGSVEMRNVVATQKIYVETDTGDVEFSAIDAPALQLKTDTGDVEGSLQSGKLFTYKTSTGDVRLPVNGGNGTCDIQTSTGDINITIK